MDAEQHIQAQLIGKARQKRAGEFLKVIRSRLRPTQQELQAHPEKDRRVPGLTRWEMATRLGCEEDTLRKLEQGLCRITPEMVQRFVRIAALDDVQALYLSELVTSPSPAESEFAALMEGASAQRTVDHLEPNIAYVQNPRWDVLAANCLTRALLGLDDMRPKERNIMRLMFCKPIFREVIEEWDVHATRIVGQFKHRYPRYAGDPAMEQFIHEMFNSSDSFRTLWNLAPLKWRKEGRKVIHHPKHGRLVLHQTTFPTSAYELVLYTPLAERILIVS